MRKTFFVQCIIFSLIVLFASCSSDDFTADGQSTTLKATEAKPHFIMDFTIWVQYSPWDGSPGDTYYDINGIALNNPGNKFPENVGFNFVIAAYDKYNNVLGGSELHTWRKTGNPFPDNEVCRFVREPDRLIDLPVLHLDAGYNYPGFDYDTAYEGYEDYDFTMGTMLQLPCNNGAIETDWQNSIKYSGFTNDVIVDVEDATGKRVPILNRSYSNYGGTINFETQAAIYTISLAEYVGATHTHGLPRYKVVVNP